MANNSSSSSTRKRKVSQLFDSTTFVTNDDPFSMLLQKQSISIGSSHLTCASRLRRCFSAIQNVSKGVALKVLKSVQSNEIFEECRDEFMEWKILLYTEYLRHVFNPCMDSSQTEWRVAKRQKLSVEEGMQQEIERERSIVKKLVDDMTEYIEREGTSYDDMVEGISQSFCYHPSKAMELFTRSLAKNRCHFSLYLHIMEPYRQSGQKVDCIKSLKYAKYLVECEVAEIEEELRVETGRILQNLHEMNVPSNEHEDIIASTSIIQTLTEELNEAKSTNKIFEGLIYFFSDGSTEDMFHVFNAAVAYSRTSIYAYCNLGVLNAFNIHGSRDSCVRGIELLEKALHCCTVKDFPVISSFLYHTIAQTYMRMNNVPEALNNIAMSLKYNPKMILALFERSSIYKATNQIEKALQDNDLLIEIQPETAFEHSNIYCNRAVLHFKLNQEAQMIEALNKSISIDPSNSFAFILLSKHAILKGDLESFEKIKNKFYMKGHLHITHFLKHLIEGYTHFLLPEKAKIYQDQLANYEGCHWRIE